MHLALDRSNAVAYNANFNKACSSGTHVLSKNNRLAHCTAVKTSQISQRIVHAQRSCDQHQSYYCKPRYFLHYKHNLRHSMPPLKEQSWHVQHVMLLLFEITLSVPTLCSSMTPTCTSWGCLQCLVIVKINQTLCLSTVCRHTSNWLAKADALCICRQQQAGQPG